MTEQYNPPVADIADFDFSEDGYSPNLPLEADIDFLLGIHNILGGTSNIFIAIWADLNADQYNNRMYALSWGSGVALSVLDLSTKNLYDHYTQNFDGRGKEPLINSDTIDLNVKAT